MYPRSARALTAAAVGVVVLAAACGSSSSPKAASTASPSTKKNQPTVKTIAVTMSDTSCEPRRIETTAGPHTFSVTNHSTKIPEFEVRYGNSIIGEAENLAPGAHFSFSLNLGPGSYTTRCPNAKFPDGSLEVAPGATGKAADSAARAKAVSVYLAYVRQEADALGSAIKPFAAAVKRGDVGTGKRLYASTRYHYEAIEPVAESFGTLDPAIDIGEDDATSPSQFTGFHRIEKALWHDNSLAGMAPVADKLVADITDLRARIARVKLQPEQIANGAAELLNEMSTEKVTGEEDAFSHTDLSDIAANLAGAKAAFQSLRALLSTRDVPLTRTITDRFFDVQNELNRFQANDPIGNGYARYSTLTPQQTRDLSRVLKALAQPVSKVAAELLGNR